MEFDGSLALLGPLCSEPAKIDLVSLLRDEFFQTGFCPNSDCDSARIAVDCVIASRRKRSTEAVEFNVTFNIRNNK